VTQPRPPQPPVAPTTPTPPPPKPPPQVAPSPPAVFAIGPLDVVNQFPIELKAFAPTSFWNAALPATAPLAPDSARMATALSAEVRREIRLRTGPWINTNEWSVPVYTVGAGVPAVRVTLDNRSASLQRDFDAVPIPANARAAGGSDHHLTIYQPATDTLWEFWGARRSATGWRAAWGGKMTSVSTNPGYFPAPYGASGTSLPLIGGLMTIHELETGQVDHALAIAIPNTAQDRFVWPAQRGDGRTTGETAIPEGTRFRIDPSLNLDTLGLSPVGLAIARAVQRYGMVVRDTGGNFAFYAEDATPSGGKAYGKIFGPHYPNALLDRFPWSRLQVVAPGG
jgi:hypothetical protein